MTHADPPATTPASQPTTAGIADPAADAADGDSTPPAARPIQRLSLWLDEMAARKPVYARIIELFKFGFVGGMAFIIDVGLFNLLRFGPGEILGAKPLTAKVVSAVVATVFSWVCNRYWTFAKEKTTSRTKEFIGYALVNVIGMVVTVACLWFSHYVLNLRSPLADNISGNIIGVGLGTVVRYLGYKFFVFTGAKETQPSALV